MKILVFTRAAWLGCPCSAAEPDEVLVRFIGRSESASPLLAMPSLLREIVHDLRLPYYPNHALTSSPVRASTSDALRPAL